MAGVRVHYWLLAWCAHALGALANECSKLGNCERCKHNLGCFWCVPAQRCHGLFDDTEQECGWSTSYWLVCSVNAIVSVAITCALLLMLSACCCTACCWLGRRVKRYRDDRLEREYEAMGDSFAARRRAAEAESERSRQRRDEIRHKYGHRRSRSGESAGYEQMPGGGAGAQRGDQ